MHMAHFANQHMLIDDDSSMPLRSTAIPCNRHKILCYGARLQWGVRFVRAAWRLGSGVDEVGVWIMKVVLVINLVVRTEEKSGRGLTRLEMVQSKERRKRPGGVLGELQEEGQPAADSQHPYPPIGHPGRRAVPAQGAPSLPTEGWATCPLQSVR